MWKGHKDVLNFLFGWKKRHRKPCKHDKIGVKMKILHGSWPNTARSAGELLPLPCAPPQPQPLPANILHPLHAAAEDSACSLVHAPPLHSAQRYSSSSSTSGWIAELPPATTVLSPVIKLSHDAVEVWRITLFFPPPLIWRVTPGTAEHFLSTVVFTPTASFFYFSRIAAVLLPGRESEQVSKGKAGKK